MFFTKMFTKELELFLSEKITVSEYLAAHAHPTLPFAAAKLLPLVLLS